MGNVVMTQALRNAGVAASGHGFRSSFKGWARQHDMNELLSEFALAHVEGSATVAAYARDDLLAKRRPVMQAWADCISGWRRIPDRAWAATRLVGRSPVPDCADPGEARSASPVEALARVQSGSRPGVEALSLHALIGRCACLRLSRADPCRTS